MTACALLRKEAGRHYTVADGPSLDDAGDRRTGRAKLSQAPPNDIDLHRCVQAQFPVGEPAVAVGI